MSVALPHKIARSLDDAMQLRIASDDPMGFVKRTDSQTMVIDEIHKEPEGTSFFRPIAILGRI